MIRSDMAVELVGGKTEIADSARIKKSRIEVDAEVSAKIKKPEGIYITVETGIVNSGRVDKYDTLSKALSCAVRELSPDTKSVLVVGLGNPNLTADALGQKVFSNLLITRHLSGEYAKESGLDIGVSVSAICPNVSGVTGIESFDVIKGVVDRVKPGLVIAVDSLASAAVGRIASAFQLCSTGITPGSGVANHRMRLDKDSLGVDVISIGVPLVVYASTIIQEATGSYAPDGVSDIIMNLIVTPKTIDLLVEECGKIIASAINRAFS